MSTATPGGAPAYPQVSLDAPLGALDAKLLVECEDEQVLLSRVRARENTLRLQAHISDGRLERLWDVPRNRSLRSAVAAVTGRRPTRAFQLPPGRIGRTHPFAAGFLRGMIVLASLVLIALGVFRLVQQEPPVFLAGALLGAGAFGLYQSFRTKLGRHQWTFSTSSETTTLGDMRQPEALPPVDVDDVKAEYGKLLSDIVYRIEYPALFDPGVPTTKAFTVALLQWDNNQGLLGDEETRQLAARIRGSFEAARAHAETVGMDHLPEGARDGARTALHAARLAADERASSAERASALEKAIQLLDSLALYYLPTGPDVRLAIEGRTMLALPGRRARTR